MDNENNNTPGQFTDPAFNQPEEFPAMPEDDYESQPIPLDDKEEVEEVVHAEPVHKETIFYDAFSSAEEEVSEITLPIPSKRLTREQRVGMLKLLREQLADELDEEHAIELLKEAINVNTTIEMLTYVNGEYDEAMENSDGHLRQVLKDSVGKGMRCHYPNFVPDKSGKLKGRNSVRYLSAMMGTSRPTAQPLWNSGILIRVDTIPESQLLALQEIMSQTNISLGMSTKGAVFSGDDVYILGTLLEFILDRVLDSTMKDGDPDTLADTILITDAPGILAATLASIYPKGYPMIHECVNVEKGKCDFIIKSEKDELGIYKPDSMLDFSKIWWADRRKLSPTDVSYFSKPINSVTAKEIKEYQERLGTVVNPEKFYEYNFESARGSVKQNITYRVHFRVPTISRYLKETNRWITAVGDMVDRIIAKDSDTSETARRERRMILLSEQSFSLDITKHRAWLDRLEIHYPDGTVHTVDDQDTVDEVLLEASRLKGFHKGFTSSIREFKESMTIGHAGVNNFACPKCGEGQVDPDEKFKSLIPLNLVSCFFTLMELMTASVLNRRG